MVLSAVLILHAVIGGVVLSNEHLSVTFGALGGITQIEQLTGGKAKFGVTGDSISISITTTAQVKFDLSPGSGLPTAPHITTSPGIVALSYAVATMPDAAVGVEYSLKSGWTSLTKTVSIGGAPHGTTITSVALLGEAGATISSGCGAAGWASDYGKPESLNHAAAFHRCAGEGEAAAPGMMFSVANPYPQTTSSSIGEAITAGYGNIGINVTKHEGTAAATTTMFVSDMLVIAPYQMRKGWVRPHSLSGVDHSKSPPMLLNTGERDVFVAAVTSQLLPSPSYDGKQTVKVNVAWDENDYQIDLASPAGRTEYKRIIDRNAEFNVSHMVFGPTNSDLQNGDFFDNRDSRMDTGWEEVLWWGFGVGIRNGTWGDLEHGLNKTKILADVPPSLQELLTHAKEKGVKLMAYVYPIIVGFDPSSSSSSSSSLRNTTATELPDDNCTHQPWLYPSKNAHVDRLTCHSDLGSVEYQTWLVKALDAFYTVFSDYCGGFSFDGVFLGETNMHTNYAQWRGWANVLENLKRMHPDIVIDNRLSAHGLGPWHMLAGSYDEPIAGDENPETYGIPVTSVRTDHVAGDNLRRVNYWYRQGSLVPMRRIPGFFGHQTDRSRGDLARPDVPMAQCENMTAGGTMNCYKRDYDLLGYKYALMSQLATAGLNNVVCMTPSRDLSEFTLFPKADVAFITNWLAWTDTHIAYLENTVPLIDMDEVALGLVDGTAAFKDPLSCAGGPTSSSGSRSGGDGDESPLGFVWLFNPAYAKSTASVTLNDELVPVTAWTLRNGCNHESGAGPSTEFTITQLYPLDGTAPVHAKWNESITFNLDGSSAVMLQVSLAASARVGAASVEDEPRVKGIVAESVRWNGSAGILVLDGVVGAYGAETSGVTVTVPQNVSGAAMGCAASAVLVNGVTVATDACTTGATTTHTLPRLRFGGVEATPFPHSNEIVLKCTHSAHTAVNFFDKAAACKPNDDGNVSFSGSTLVPRVVFDQLDARNKGYPILWDARDDDASWLRPQRLLVFLQLNCTTGRAGACDDTMFASLSIGVRHIPALKAYESRCVECTNVNHPFTPNKSARFNGFYWDLSTVLAPDAKMSVELVIQPTFIPLMQGLYFEGVEPIVTGDFAVLE